ncbi:hypothetical protein [Bradyrhizobium valentinum]|uniref:Uncharacterized protein n=1 Tax=Bradyrhizobium valentinum TaxID=1518501 RepID=A0A0R3LBZ1_9BRAD|nr:hypothetical protein [Bradyrhizobium valentinum]KRQ88429.1 hypothetical protein CQ10_38105 [Bradyrhizobium valentinum]KRR03279.1 hypothetical protein CP49_15195 [Bradyrhizobium valentinum]
MPTKIPNPEADASQQVPPRRHDAGSGANETTDGLDASTEALRHAAEDTPSGALPDDLEKAPVFDRADLAPKIEVAVMVKKKHGVMIETPTEARQAEPGPSILLLLIISVSIAVIAMAFVWFLFFRYLVSGCVLTPTISRPVMWTNCHGGPH